uniref:Glutathione peroxidase n=1 Tax=Parascaris equorum TaxID=6256 RepID=A0A914S2C4_PAREQ
MSSSKQTIYDFTVKDAEGHDVGKVVLIVNVASKCGLTSSNYAQLKELLDTYGDKGFVIATFPCNQFGGQEPECEVDIRNFVKDKFKFEPDLYGKIDVKRYSPTTSPKSMEKDIETLLEGKSL